MKALSTTCSILLLSSLCLHADLRLPAILSDHAMFQANQPIQIWGWTDPGAKVKVTFTSGDAASSPGFDATAGAEGKWSGQLSPLKDGVAGTLAISTDKGERKIINDLLVGEVWLGSGQSNMQYALTGWGHINPDEAPLIANNIEIAKKEADAAKPPIRYFGVKMSRSITPQDDVSGNWILVDAKTVPHCSAVAWNFALALQDKLQVPVGMIVSAVGDTPVQCWMSKEALASTSCGAAIAQRNQQNLALDTPEIVKKYTDDLAAWKAANPTPDLQMKNHASAPVHPPDLGADNHVPNQYYNTMIHGLQPYTIQGVIWFQGDGNQGNAYEYPELIQAMIKEWRAEWNEQLPFYYVEVNNMQAPGPDPVQYNNVSLIREQQQGALALPKTAVVSSIDLGIFNAHFPNKKPVGQRLANIALKEVYGQPLGLVYCPQFKSFEIQGAKVRLHFENADGLRAREGGEVKGFAIRGAQGDWVWANGTIDGTDILVSSDQVPAPTAVRYAWALNPVISIENGAGLPLRPFRTDKDSKK